MSLYFRLSWTWLRARFKSPIQMGDTIELIMRVWPNDLDINGHMNNGRYMTAPRAIVGSEGFVSSADARDVMGLNPASPEFPASISAWIETERLMSVW